MTFLAMVARTKGRVLQGGIPDKVMAARLVIKDWNRGKIPYYSVPPTTTTNMKTSATDDENAKIVTSFADEFDVNKILEAHDKELMAGLDDIDEMDFVRMEATVYDISKKSKAAGEILDYLTNGKQEREDEEDDEEDDDEDMDNDDDDNDDNDGAMANAKMEEAEDYDFDQE